MHEHVFSFPVKPRPAVTQNANSAVLFSGYAKVCVVKGSRKTGRVMC